MQTEAHDEQKPTGTQTQLRDVGDYEYSLTEHGTHVWTHLETGLQVELRKAAGQRDGYGRINKGYRGVARDAAGDLVDQLCGSSFGGYLPNLQDAARVAANWMRDRPDGRLRGDEEVDH